MRDLLRIVGAGTHGTLGAVLHVGAGSCVELEDFQRLNAEKILLVEANPELAERLRRKARGAKEVQVVGAAVAAQASEDAVLRVLNNPRESSLLQPTQLLDRFPNLRVARELTVTAVPLAQMIRRLAPEASRPNLLVIEAPGIELSLLTSIPPEELQKFSWIAVRASAEPLHQGGAQLEEVDAALGRAGFRRAAPLQPGTGLPFENLLYELDAQRVYGTLMSDLQAQNQSKSEQAVQLQAELEERARSETRLKEEITQARQTASLSTKLQALREADLKDLQDRYRASLSIQERQHEMLVKVAERLKAASRYFHQMVENQDSPSQQIEEEPGAVSGREAPARPASVDPGARKGGA